MSKNIKVNHVFVIIYNNKAFMPTQGKVAGTIKHGKFYITNAVSLIIDPIYETNIESGEIVSAVEVIIKEGYPILSEEFTINYMHNRTNKSRNPLLKVTKVKSHKFLREHAKSYAILWKPENIVVEIEDHTKELILSLDTPLKDVVNTILKDFREKLL